MWTYANTATVGLSISGGTATCTGAVSPSSNSNNSSVSMTLKRKVGSTWETYGGAWTASGTGASGCSVKKTKAVVSGYYYKVVVVGKIKNSAGTVLETITVESSQKYY
ncbi:hypothetical protein LJC33_00440 [Eubacteriales bacterium OttesenSCG-928-N13]|nr:hypothetical protein [Eubacteriales bacterium OttesenSCG-928-N13]